jgi:hypothetical protein
VSDLLKTINPSGITINPDGSVIYTDKQLADAIADSIGPRPYVAQSDNSGKCTNGGVCSGGNYACNNTGDCKDTLNTGGCHPPETVSPPV